MIKHGPSTDLEDLDFEAVDKEIKEDKGSPSVSSDRGVNWCGTFPGQQR